MRLGSSRKGRARRHLKLIFLVIKNIITTVPGATPALGVLPLTGKGRKSKGEGLGTKGWPPDVGIGPVT